MAASVPSLLERSALGLRPPLRSTPPANGKQRANSEQIAFAFLMTGTSTWRARVAQNRLAVLAARYDGP